MYYIHYKQTADMKQKELIYVLTGVHITRTLNSSYALLVLIMDLSCGIYAS